MLATPGTLPRGTGWVYEVKWDGMRVLADIGVDGSLRLRSRSGSDVTAWFPELAPLAALRRDAILDGEVVALEDAGAPSFERLSTRFGVASRRRAAALAAATPVVYMVFDLLRLDERDLTGQPLRSRREALTALALPDAGPCHVPEAFDDADALLAVTAERGLEGVVAKRLDAPYRPGVRSTDWVKQSHRESGDAVVVGWRPGAAGDPVSLAVATVADGSLHYRGTAGSGISGRMASLLRQRLRRAPAPPDAAGLAQDADRLAADGFVWAQPGTVVEIRHLGAGASGRFRQPVVERVRVDLTAADLGLRRRTDPLDDAAVSVSFGGRTLQVGHLDKVLYPATSTTKAEVIAYYATVAPHLLALAEGRPVSRRRWPDGVAAGSFWEKNLPGWAPEWIPRAVLPTSKEPITFPVLGPAEGASLVWLAAHSALELHTPQWRVGSDGRPLAPDRLVIDLDPGPGVGLPECCEAALLVRDLLAQQGLAAHAVLSGSKGLHLYAPLAGPVRSSDAVTEQVKRIGERCASQAPGLIVTTMARSARVGRVFLDWSQNRAAKTTLAPWSLRGTGLPQVALPVSWEAVASGRVRQTLMGEALEALASGDAPVPW